LLSALALTCMSYRMDSTLHAYDSSSVFGDIKEGFGYLLAHRGLLANSAMSVGAAAGAGATGPLFFLLAVRVIGGGPKTFGFLEAALGLGLLTGSILMASIAPRVKRGLAMVAGYVITGLGVVLLSLVASVWPAVTILFFVGVANSAALIATDTYVQQAVPEELRGRVWGTRFALTQGTYALSVLAGGFLAGYVQVPVLFIVAGVIVAVPALVGFTVRDIRDA
jgi:MFS family permease